MRLFRLPVLICALVCSLAAPCPAQEERFSFYGLAFGTTRAEAAKLVQLQGTMVNNPGHGMSELELVFDREDLLMEIRASWPRPDDPLHYQGFLRALREKFVTPVSAKYPSVSATIDEYSNRAAVRLVFLATGLRERNIEFHKNKYLKMME
jgi:hypothetical protein